MSQPDHHAVLQDFFTWERQSWVEVVADITTDEKAYFMPVEALKSYFNANGSRKLNKILSEVFQTEYITINPEVILRGHTAVFCILLRISKGRYIEHFARFEELSDQRLPFDPTNPPACFPEATDDPRFLQRFCEKQWMYCVPVFDNHMLHKHFGPQRLLPITYKERRGGGGSAIIYKIKLYGPHNKLLPAGSQIQMNNTNPNTFILKRYLTKDAEDHYKQEVSGFSHLKHPESIIGFYGSYTHGEDYNILLEFADKGSLEEYFQTETPPSRGGDIIKFWDGLFQLIKGLKAIHSILGWHQDVKPANVLVLSYGAESAFDWQFKLADFGLSHFISKVPSEGDAMANDARGTRTYGAPECYMPYDLDDQMGSSSTKITQAVDIWSLGCIYSEGAMWIVDGYKGVVDYRRQRMAETDKILNFKGGDCFHDGERVLNAVLDVHKDIEKRLRRSDYITKDVLDSMVEEMLWDEDRPGAKVLWRKAEKVLTTARQRLSSNTGEDSSTRYNNSNRYLTYPQPQSPPKPPPERPRVLPPGLSITEQKHPAYVEMWRSQVSGVNGALGSPAYGREQIYSPESISELDRELTGSLSSWQVGSSSPQTSPVTSPFTSPHASSQYDFHRHPSTEARPRPLQSWRSSGHKMSNELSHGQTHMDTGELSDDGPVAPNAPKLCSEFSQEGIAMSPTDGEGNSDSVVDNEKKIGQGSRHPSSAYSIPIIGPAVRSDSPSYPFSPDYFQIPPKSQKRSTQLSSFPSTIYTNPAPPPTVINPITWTSTHHDSVVARSGPFPNNLELPAPTHLSTRAHSVEHLSLAAAIEWKKAHKVKKHARVPSLPGTNLLDELKDRDHVFIIDDGISMREQWHGVKTVFEALSYILKSMAPDGIELFYTVSYDAWRRHNTSELGVYLEKKEVAGDTDISYRLGLQLQSYKAKIHPTPRKASSKSKKVRPMSFYILTDGNWKAGGNAKAIAAIKDIADHLIKADLKSGQLAIQFISFGQNAEALQRINRLARTDFGLGIVDTTPWTDNVLKMLYGALNKSLFEDPSALPSTTSSASTLILQQAAPPPSELA